ncbi:siderophore ABC transporter substrate-binding protein [Sphingobacterium hungaricum]|uniref:ABC transporter n=1 Tax=Sphingobacterium hungaricum TaxID=2082723 RepID=A0A928YPQ4_9SPHI|nr:siderophore ABC transporter substrate-binding protein [Sphingobacterium hungaricum]MBE8712782.1 ABC transporter [Sphingobacterium hungaricum]
MNKILQSALLLFAIIGLSSCNSSQQEGSDSTDTVVVEHKLGKTTVNSHPKNIVVFDMGALETLDELGVPVVGIPKDHVPDHLSKYKTNTEVADAGSLLEPNFEKINAMQPDLILISERQVKNYEELSKIAPTIYVGVDPKDYMNSFEKNVLLIGQLVNKEAEAKEKVDATKAKLADAQAKLAGNDKKALVIMHNNGRFSANGKGSRFGFIFTEMGLKPAQDDLEVATHGQKISNEFIAEINPDYLFVVDRNAVVSGQPVNKSEIENKLIQQTNAYKNGKIIYLDPQIWYLSGGGLTSTNRMIDDILAAASN